MATPSAPPAPTAPTAAQRDYLDEDPEIREQKFCLLSFLSPEEAVGSRNAFAAGEFLRSFAADVAEALSKISQYEPEMARRITDRYHYLLDPESAAREFDAYLSEKAEEITEKYVKEKGDFTSTRGVKVRGSYPTLEEASARAERLKKIDKNFHVFVGQVGMWLPFSPSPDSIKESKYSEDDLQDLMKAYKDNIQKKDEFYAMRQDMMKSSATKEGGGGDDKDEASVADLQKQLEELDEVSKKVIMGNVDEYLETRGAGEGEGSGGP